MRSFPWDSIVTGIEDGLPILDRTYHASDLREVYKTFFSNGVFIDVEDAFQVTAVADELAVLVAPGKCNIEGTLGWDGSGRKLVLQAASSSADRIDTVVLRWNANNDIRDIDLYVKTGTAQDIPVRPQLTRNDTVYELGLCDIYVARGTGTVTQQRITDTRLDDGRCGVVTPFIDVDTTTFFDQLQTATDMAVEAAENFINGVFPDGFIEERMIADGAVTSGKIKNGAIATADIADKAVSKAKMSQDVQDFLSSGLKVVRVKKTKAEWGSGLSSMFTAPEVSGWKFSHWGPSPAASGQASALVYSAPADRTSNVWLVYSAAWSSVTDITCFAVYTPLL